MTPPSQMVPLVGRLTLSLYLILYLAESIMSVILGVFNTRNVKRTTNMIQYMSGVPPLRMLIVVTGLVMMISIVVIFTSAKMVSWWWVVRHLLVLLQR